jgi:predicted transcriptional regulator
MVNLICHEIENDVLFVTEKSQDVWWYDGERIAFRTPSYGKILQELRREPKATLAYLQEEIGINRSALQKLLQTLLDKHYVERDADGSWRVFITPSM